MSYYLRRDLWHVTLLFQMIWRNYVGGKKSFRLHVTDDSEMFSLDKEKDYMVQDH